ncbi:benzoate-CoA ligase family protein [Actinomadura sp. DC4]|uniref:benzoate-CoA ligase family protein n=1 Tax=Actinomadura sp. DC4 TaxID=3055069 RepID=UPI0025B05BEC|nr:benzoate-CoA ligase family protein [Actinomadura sp. DC4]MDN3351251.1 benzoate-CoA ligase family protein [Actinomadura sp. DC4]
MFNACTYLVDRHVESGGGDRTAVTGPGGTLTYAELLERVRRMASGLRGLGVRPEERVLIYMPDSPDMLALILGAMRAGAVPVPVSTMMTAKDLAEVLRDSRARVLAAGAEFAAAAEEAARLAPDLAAFLLTGDTPPQAPEWAQSHLLAKVADNDGIGDPYPTSPDSSALWLYTSGTTGLPKAAVHRHASIRSVYETYGAQVLGIRPGDRCLSVPKLFFAYGIGNSCFFPLAAGASAVLEPSRPTPALIAERLCPDDPAERPTLFFGVPTFYAALLAADLPPETFSSVRQAVSAGEPLPAPIFRRFGERFGVEILDGIGATEALHIFVSNRPGAVRPGTTGTPVPGYDVRIVDDAGAEVAPGTPGHLMVRGDSIATGYWCRTEVTRRVFQGEWLRTGDTYVDEGGSLRFLGRSDDMIKAGGIWVSPSEVEARLLEHPGVAQAVVVAVPDGDGLDKPVAGIVRAGGSSLTEDEVIAFCREGLASFKRPRAVFFLDTLPTTATGKIQRYILRDALRESGVTS